MLQMGEGGLLAPPGNWLEPVPGCVESQALRSGKKKNTVNSFESRDVDKREDSPKAGLCWVVWAQSGSLAGRVLVPVLDRAA